MRRAATLFAVMGAILLAASTEASLGECGKPRAGGPVATDALEVLATAVGTSDCGGFDPCICDVNSAGGATATDALLVLSRAVGQNVTLTCPCVVSTTTTTTLPQPVETVELIVMTRNEGSYALADLAGTWDASTLGTGGPDAPWWSRGTITIQSNGRFSGTLTGIDGFTEKPSGRLAISADGIVTCPSGCLPGLQGSLSAAKTFMAFTNTWEEGMTELLVLTLRGASYSQSNLAGDWQANDADSSYGIPSWRRGAIAIEANGDAAGSLDVSDGSSAAVDASFVLSGAGRITCTSGCATDLLGALDSGKTIGAWTYTAPGGAAHLAVVCKAGASYSTPDLTGDWYASVLASGADAPDWGRGFLAIDSDGAFSGTLEQSNGGSTPVSGSMTISGGGVVGVVGDPSFRCVMDAAKSILACTVSR